LDNNIPFNFYFKTMKGVDFQTDIITLNIKTIKKTIKPFSEYTERFREVS
jgi:predicted transcriptional regulator